MPKLGLYLSTCVPEGIAFNCFCVRFSTVSRCDIYVPIFQGLVARIIFVLASKRYERELVLRLPCILVISLFLNNCLYGKSSRGALCAVGRSNSIEFF